MEEKVTVVDGNSDEDDDDNDYDNGDSESIVEW